MIYYTGDLHGSNDEIIRFCEKHDLTDNDTVILLGDVGANYYGGWKDKRFKKNFTFVTPTFLCIHGNHEMRPASLDTYIEKEWNGGTVWYEREYPNLLFAKDGEIYTIEGLRHIAIGGAYSVDKYYRLTRGYGWWQDEQPSEEIKAYVESQLASNPIDIILSHTCPFKYEPIEMFLSGIDQSTVGLQGKQNRHHADPDVIDFQNTVSTVSQNSGKQRCGDHGNTIQQNNTQNIKKSNTILSFHNHSLWKRGRNIR